MIGSGAGGFRKERLWIRAGAYIKPTQRRDGRLWNRQMQSYGILLRPEITLSGRSFDADQLTLVMVQPQRGHSEPCPERQVVPQWEQVEAVAALPPFAQVPQA